MEGERERRLAEGSRLTKFCCFIRDAGTENKRRLRAFCRSSVLFSLHLGRQTLTDWSSMWFYCLDSLTAGVTNLIEFHEEQPVCCTLLK